MNKKTMRLSKGFWHRFIPNTNKLISPQNIKFEIWDLNIRKIIDKWDPQMFCIRNCAFNKSGNKFILSGGCNGGESEFKIYNTENLELIKEFWFPEQSDNAVFVGDETFIFGSWDGNIYQVNINDTIVFFETKTKIDNKTYTEYFVGNENKNNLLQIENVMINLAESDIDNNNIFFVIRPKSLNVKTDLHLYSDYVLAYNLKTKEQIEIKLPITKNRFQIQGIKYYNGKLAILKTIYGGMENDNVFHIASLFLYDLVRGELSAIKEDFKLRDVFARAQSIAWNVDGKLAFISLNGVVIIDLENKNEEIAIPFDRPTSVEFSENGEFIAIGGDKAILCKLA